MKYLFINVTAGFGSTGRIVAETCRTLMAQGHQCLIAYGRMENSADGIPTVAVSSRMEVLSHALQSRIFDNAGFASCNGTRRFLETVREYDPDVIWLHNLHGYYIHLPLLFSYLRTCGKEIHWMLHDCWAFTGHCAHFTHIGCGRWKTGCHDCPQKNTYPKSMLLDRSARNYRLKKELFTGIPNLTLHTPSHWMASRIRESFLKDYPIEVQHNTVDTSVFRPVTSDFREKHGLVGKKIVLGVSNVWYEQKGISDFCRLAGMLKPEYQVVLIGLSPSHIRKLPDTILKLPRTAGVQELVEAYSAADVYVTPSTEESFGMTVLEATCCGTPAVVYRDTACEEIVNTYGGIAVPRGAEHLMAAIYRLTEETE